MALVTTTPVATSITATSVVPHVILPVDAMGSHLHPSELRIWSWLQDPHMITHH